MKTMDKQFATAQSMLVALRTKRISAQELLAWHLERIECYNPDLNAIVTFNEEQALQRAIAADAAIARGVLLGPLHGLPVTIKDCIEVAGLPTTAGVPQRAQAISTTTAPVAQSVLDAGAVLLGKTNLPPFATDWQSSNPLFGRTNNPWDLTRTPGGSTGGGAAALAAGLTPLEFGSDLGGSLRIPPAFCGVYGHRPSETAVPRSGHIPGSPLENPAIVMNVMGPLARSAIDLDLALSIIAEPIVGEDVAWRLMFPPVRHTALADFRIAVLSPVPWLPVDGEILAALEDLTARLRRLGALVEMVQPEGFDLRQHHEAYSMLLSVIAFAHLDGDERAHIIELLQQSSDQFAKAQIAGVNATVSQFIGMHGQRGRYRAIFREFFRKFDVLLAPVTITPAFPHISDQVPILKRTLQVNGAEVPYMYLPIFAGVASYSGLPATAFPWGRTRGGLPIGLQAIGPYLEDRMTIAFASMLEREFGGFTPPPGYQ
ncbi:MAG: amidase family protein [Ktedonobacteraceae bacterium]